MQLLHNKSMCVNLLAEFIPLTGLEVTLEHFLDRRRVADEAHGHLQSLRGDVTDPALHVVRDPLDEVRGVLVLHVEHLLVNLLGRHAATEETRRREVPQ